MKLTNYKVKNKRSLGVFAVAVVVLMLGLRAILYYNGTIDAMYTLEADDLLEAITAYEVCISATKEDGTITLGSGTILDGQRASTTQDYTLTIATALHVTGADPEAVSITITLGDGSTVLGSLIAYDETSDLAFVQCLYPEELEVYYSRDILERLEEEEAVYALFDAELIAGYCISPGIDIEGVGQDLIAADLGADDGMSGAGLYGKSGNYLGMIVEGTDDGIAAVIPGDVIMKKLDAVL